MAPVLPKFVRVPFKLGVVVKFATEVIAALLPAGVPWLNV